MPEVRVTMDDMRKAGHCAAGIRDFFIQHDLDLHKLVREGIPVSDFDGIEDANLARVIELATERANG